MAPTQHCSVAPHWHIAPPSGIAASCGPPLLVALALPAPVLMPLSLEPPNDPLPEPEEPLSPGDWLVEPPQAATKRLNPTTDVAVCMDSLVPPSHRDQAAHRASAYEVTWRKEAVPPVNRTKSREMESTFCRRAPARRPAPSASTPPSQVLPNEVVSSGPDISNREPERIGSHLTDIWMSRLADSATPRSTWRRELVILSYIGDDGVARRQSSDGTPACRAVFLRSPERRSRRGRRRYEGSSPIEVQNAVLPPMVRMRHSAQPPRPFPGPPPPPRP